MTSQQHKIMHNARTETAHELAGLMEVRRGFFGRGAWVDYCALAELDRSIRAHLDKLLNLFPVPSESE